MIGFCFTGEGARGAIQAGIALGLHRKGIDADYTIGVSSGSCCAAAYAYAGPDGLADMWRKIRWVFSVFGLNWNWLWNRGLLNQKPAERIIRRLISNPPVPQVLREDSRGRRYYVPVCEGVVSRLNISTGELQYISSKSTSPEEFGEAALGGFAISALVSDRNGWVDAGSRQMAPLRQCIDAGCSEIYVIMGRPFILPEQPLPRGILAAAKMAFRALDMSLLELMMRDIESCLRDDGKIPIHIVSPKSELYDCISFRKCREGVTYGLTEYEIIEERAIRSHLLPQNN